MFSSRFLFELYLPGYNDVGAARSLPGSLRFCECPDDIITDNILRVCEECIIFCIVLLDVVYLLTLRYTLTYMAATTPKHIIQITEIHQINLSNIIKYEIKYETIQNPNLGAVK